MTCSALETSAQSGPRKTDTRRSAVGQTALSHKITVVYSDPSRLNLGYFLLPLRSTTTSLSQWPYTTITSSLTSCGSYDVSGRRGPDVCIVHNFPETWRAGRLQRGGPASSFCRYASFVYIPNECNMRWVRLSASAVGLDHFGQSWEPFSPAETKRSHGWQCGSNKICLLRWDRGLLSF